MAKLGLKSVILQKNQKHFIKYNKIRIEENCNVGEEEINKDFIVSLFRELNGMLIELGIDFKINDQIDGDETYFLAKHHTYEQVRKLICDEGGYLNLKYNFDKPDLEITEPSNKNNLQRCKIQILDKSIKFDFPVIYKFNCSLCGGHTEKKTYETASATNNRVSCENIHSYISPEGEPKSKICKTGMIPDDEISVTKDAYFYNISYETSDGIYFNTKKMSDYGKLAGLNIKGIRPGARVEINPEKKILLILLFGLKLLAKRNAHYAMEFTLGKRMAWLAH